MCVEEHIEKQEKHIRISTINMGWQVGLGQIAPDDMRIGCSIKKVQSMDPLIEIISIS